MLQLYDRFTIPGFDYKFNVYKINFDTLNIQKVYGVWFYKSNTYSPIIACKNIKCVSNVDNKNIECKFISGILRKVAEHRKKHCCFI